MTEEEKKECMTCGDFLDQMGNIYGSEIGDIKKLFALRSRYGINHNMMMFGSPGCGKSRCYAIPFIFQTIRRGESLFVTDPKGELYRETAEMARAHGYTVKFFNMDMDGLLHSDSFNFMSCIGDKLEKADNMAKTIIGNLYGTADPDFWYNSEMNLLKAVLLFINTNEIGLPKTLGGVYDFLNSNTPESLEDIFATLDEEHPAKAPFNTYANGDKTVKGNTLSGLLIHMGILANKQVQQVSGIDDIDITLPGKEKCIYYIGMNDQDRTLSFLVALFFTVAFQQLVGYAKTLMEQTLPVKVTMLLDEFYNIGVIPEFDSKISQVRSRNIDCIVILQNLAQLQKMYPEDLWKSVFGCCSTKIVISVDEYEDSEYFSRMTGESTTEDEGERFNEKSLDPVKYHGEKQKTISHGSRYLYTPHEIRTLKGDHVLIFISGQNVVELQKLDYEKHPMCKEIRKVNPREHCPKWVQELSESDREKFGVYKEKYRREGNRKIKLCTEEDFLEPWSKEKQKALEERLKKERAKQKRAC